MADYWRPEIDPDEAMWGIGKHISDAVAPILERVERNEEMSKVCGNPVEVQLGAALKLKFQRDQMPFYLVPRYELERFRYGFAVLRGDGELAALIECDEEGYSTAEQVFNARVKNGLAAKLGVEMFRFTGSEIWRDLDDCVYRVCSKMGWS